MKHSDYIAKRKAKDPKYKAVLQEMEPLFEFTVELIARRNKAGLTQKQLANKLGISQTTVLELESGETKPTTDILMKLSKLFDITFIITNGTIKIKDY